MICTEDSAELADSRLCQVYNIQVLVLLRSASFGTSHEAGTDPHGLSAKHEHGGQTATIIDTTGSDDVDLIIS